jgi:transcriptional regulator with XRE-family HTH domain
MAVTTLPDAGSPTVRRSELGVMLRELRGARGWTVDDVAQRMNCSSSKISRLETGQRGVNASDIRKLCALYEITGTLREELAELAARGKQRRLLPGLPYATYADMEAGAALIRDFGLSLVPGLLQTSAYAQAVLRIVRRGEPDDVIDQLVRARVERQDVLRRSGAPRYEALIDEAALHRIVGGRAVMREQLLSLAALPDRLPNVSVRVLPFSACVAPATINKFILLSFATSPATDIVYIEIDARDGLYLKRPDQVSAYRDAYRTMLQLAANEDESRRLINEIAVTLAG